MTRKNGFDKYINVLIPIAVNTFYRYYDYDTSNIDVQKINELKLSNTCFMIYFTYAGYLF